MNLRTLKRQHDARTTRQALQYAAFSGEFDGQDLGDDDDDPWNRPAATCEHCSGTGGDPWNDGITPCEHCDGEGYEWWN